MTLGCSTSSSRSAVSPPLEGEWASLPSDAILAGAYEANYGELKYDENAAIVFLIGAVENDTAQKVQAHLNSVGRRVEASYADIVKNNDGKAMGGVTWKHIDTSVGK